MTPKPGISRKTKKSVIDFLHLHNPRNEDGVTGDCSYRAFGRQCAAFITIEVHISNIFHGTMVGLPETTAKRKYSKYVVRFITPAMKFPAKNNH